MHPCRIRHISVMQVKVPPRNVLIVMKVIDPTTIERRRPANQSMNLIALIQQLLGHIRAILTGHTGDEGTPLLGHFLLQGSGIRAAYLCSLR